MPGRGSKQHARKEARRQSTLRILGHRIALLEFRPRPRYLDCLWNFPRNFRVDYLCECRAPPRGGCTRGGSRGAPTAQSLPAKIRLRARRFDVVTSGYTNDAEATAQNLQAGGKHCLVKYLTLSFRASACCILALLVTWLPSRDDTARLPPQQGSHSTNPHPHTQQQRRPMSDFRMRARWRQEGSGPGAPEPAGASRRGWAMRHVRISTRARGRCTRPQAPC